jgi:hypothetical protein
MVSCELIRILETNGTSANIVASIRKALRTRSG